MKQASLYARRIKQLFTMLKKEGGKPAPPRGGTPNEIYLIGILSCYASESRASTALSKLTSATVDLNDIRVTPVAELVQMVGTDYPNVRRACEDIVYGLRTVFNRQHSLDLSFLESCSKKLAEQFMNSLDGVNPHARALLTMRCLRTHAVPIDDNMLNFLRDSGCLPEDCDAETAQKFVASQIKEKDAETFYALFKKYAATHSGRKAAEQIAGARASRSAGRKKTAMRTASKKKAKKRTSSKKKAKKATTKRRFRTTKRKK